MAEFIDHLPERVVLVAESLGDLLLRSPFEEDGPERLIAAMVGMGGMGEELPVRVAVHNGCSLGMSVVLLAKSRGQINRVRRCREGNGREIAARQPA